MYNCERAKEQKKNPSHFIMYAVCFTTQICFYIQFWPYKNP